MTRGVSPMDGSTRTRNLLDGIERAMSDEARSASARLFTETHGATQGLRGGKPVREESAPAPNTSDGQILKLPAHFGDKLIETRPKFEPVMVNAHQTITRLTCTEHGIPVQPALPTNVDGTSLREAYRRWCAASLRPLASRIERQLRHRVDASIRIEMEALRARDMQGAARAVASLAQAGFTASQAAAPVGLLDERA